MFERWISAQEVAFTKVEVDLQFEGRLVFCRSDLSFARESHRERWIGPSCVSRNSYIATAVLVLASSYY